MGSFFEPLQPFLELFDFDCLESKVVFEFSVVLNQRLVLNRETFVISLYLFDCFSDSSSMENTPEKSFFQKAFLFSFDFHCFNSIVRNHFLLFKRARA